MNYLGAKESFKIKNMTHDVVTIGDSAQDVFLKPNSHSLVVPKNDKALLHPLLCMGFGEKITIDDIHYDIGGSACNVAVGLKYLDINSTILSAVGNDPVAKEIKEKLQKAEIDVSLIKTFRDIKTSFSVVVNFKGERTIMVYHGLQDYSKLIIPKTLKTSWFYIGPLGKNYQDIYRQIIDLAISKSIKIALNPGAMQISDQDPLFKSMFRITKILFVNKEEALEITKLPIGVPIKEILEKLKNMGPELVVITNGPDGAYAFFDEDCYHQPPMSAERIDATGAGDAFSSGFLASWIKRNEDVETALMWGLANSSMVIEEWGAQTGLIKLDKMDEVIEFVPPLYNI